jgi:PIN domain nuclease of toxin-antitoxin system
VRKLLLDTHALLWWLADHPRLGLKAKSLIAEPRNVVYVSAAILWEISIKKSLGKLSATENLDQVVEEEGFTKLPISCFHGDQAGLLPKHHKDPFDRMLIAQAQSEGLSIITNDEIFSSYSVQIVNAST